MNKVQIVINVVLVAAVAALFVIVLSGKKQGETPTAAVEQSEVLPIAYLNTDSLLVNYVFAQEANEKLMKKQEDARLKLNTKARTLQNEMADLQELEAKLTEDIMIENQKLNIQLADTLTYFLQEFNADGRYHVILSNSAKDNVLMAAESYNITSEVIKQLNARYGK